MEMFKVKYLNQKNEEVSNSSDAFYTQVGNVRTVKNGRPQILVGDTWVDSDKYEEKLEELKEAALKERKK